MFPSPEFIEMCVEHREIVNGWWKPQYADYVRDTAENETFLLTKIEADWINGKLEDRRAERPVNWAWLPRLDQLVRMLEERGYKARWDLTSEIGQYHFTLFFGNDAPLPFKSWFGPCPEIALLECLKAVAGEGKPLGKGGE